MATAALFSLRVLFPTDRFKVCLQFLVVWVLLLLFYALMGLRACSSRQVSKFLSVFCSSSSWFSFHLSFCSSFSVPSFSSISGFLLFLLLLGFLLLFLSFFVSCSSLVRSCFSPIPSTAVFFFFFLFFSLLFLILPFLYLQFLISIFLLLLPLLLLLSFSIFLLFLFIITGYNFGCDLPFGFDGHY